MDKLCVQDCVEKGKIFFEAGLFKHIAVDLKIQTLINDVKIGCKVTEAFA